MSEENTVTEDRQRRVRRLAGLLVGGAVAASVAFAMATAGLHERARTLALDTLQRAGRTLGPDHPLTLNLSIELAMALVWDGVAADHGTDGETLPRILRSLGHGLRSARRAALYLGVVLTESTLPAQTREMAEDTWQRASVQFGPDNLSTRYVQAILALALARSGESERARLMAADIQQVSRDRAGLDSVRLLATAASTIALIGLAEIAEARALAAATVQPALDELGVGHPLYPTFQLKLGMIGNPDKPNSGG